LAAQHAQAEAVTESTHSKQDSHWRNYTEYFNDIDLAHDPFLDGFNEWEQQRIIGAFASAYRHGRFEKRKGKSRTCGAAVVSGTVRGAIDSVAKTFRDNNRRSPCHDPHDPKQLAHILRRQLKGYTNQDPATRPQKALPPRVFREMIAIATTEPDVAIGQLTGGAFFFAMRSCEYLKVSGPKRRTKLLRLRNLRFFYHRKEMAHTDPCLRYADTISITFEFQKNDERDVTITMHRTGDAVLCPVICWADLVQRVLSYKGTSSESHVCTVLNNGKLRLITSKETLNKLRARVTAIGEDVLGFKATEIGTHSIRSSAAMSMYLANVAVYTIMLIGRWSSDAFLRYIRRQVQQFSSGVSARMIISEDFYTIPETASREDPRTSGHRHNFSAHSHIGLDAPRLSQQPSFALHY